MAWGWAGISGNTEHLFACLLFLSKLMMIPRPPRDAETLPLYKVKHMVDGLLRDQLPSLAAAYELLGEAVSISDCEDRVAFVNSAAETLFGYSHDEMLGLELSEMMPEAAEVVTIDTVREIAKREWKGTVTGSYCKRNLQWYKVSSDRPDTSSLSAAPAVPVSIQDELTDVPLPSNKVPSGLTSHSSLTRPRP